MSMAIFSKIREKLLSPPKSRSTSWLNKVLTGSLYRISDMRTTSSVSDIQTQIKVMRALAKDSQVSVALSYYATDSTIPNANGQIIWATPVDESSQKVADIINDKFAQWRINSYVRDHILELATVGNLYIPTTMLYREASGRTATMTHVVLDNNTIPESDYDIIPSTKIDPENVLHLWYNGVPQGYIYQNEMQDTYSSTLITPESSIIHFSLGGLLGNYKIAITNSEGEDEEYDIQFAKPLMQDAVQPTQTLGLLEDALVLSSMSRTIKIMAVECGNAEDTEITNALLEVKQKIEQQLSLNTATGDVQSYVNPQSPNNILYVPRVNGQDPITVTDLNMAESSEQDNALLNYFLDKKLSVLGVPKEAMNFSSNEGLGGAGSVLSQRSAIYANALNRIETAYIDGWTDALNKYFINRGFKGYVGKFTLHMNPVVTDRTTLDFERRDSALSQASALVDLMERLQIDDAATYKEALMETLKEAFPALGTEIAGWNIDVNNNEPEGGRF